MEMEERSSSKQRKLVTLESSATASQFMSIVTDDLLLEILLRLPNSRSVIQCRTVCKRWFSLLSDHSQFTPRFNKFHDFYSGYTILFTKLTCVYEQDCVLFSKKSKILHKSTRSYNYLNLNRFPEQIFIEETFQDLLQVLTHDDNFYICNPLTGQYVGLPMSPQGFYQRCGFFGVYKNSQFNYKILLILDDDEYSNEYNLDVAIFCSETEKWSRLTLSCERTWAPKFGVILLKAMESYIPGYMMGKRIRLEDLLHLISLIVLVLVLEVIQYNFGSFTCPISTLPAAPCRLHLNIYAMDWFEAGCGYRNFLRLKRSTLF